MIYQYLRTTYAFLRKHKLFAIISLGGLTAALTVAYFCLQFICFELGYDAFNIKADHIYRLVTDELTASGTTFESSSEPMGPALAANFPEVRDQVRIDPDYMIVKKDDDHFREEHLAYADPSLFRIFTLPLLRGDSSTALADPFSVVLSQSAALRYFGTTDCLGEQLILDNKWPATVTGVMKNIPYNSQFRFDLFVSISTLLDRWNPGLGDNWNRFITYTYLLLDKNAQPEVLQPKVNRFLASRFQGSESKFSFALEPLLSVYLHGKARGARYGSIITGSVTNLYLFGFITLIVLIIAAFNFINLATALSLRRIREVGVRRVFGASRKQVALHFLTDGIGVALLALPGSGMFAYLLQPAFTEMVGKQMTPGPIPVILVLLLAIIIGLMGGLYPALMHARRKPMPGMKGVPRGNGLLSPTNFLVMAQFAMSVLLMVAALVAYRQLLFMRDQDPGFDKHNKIAVDFYFNHRIARHEDAVRSEFGRLKGIDGVTVSSAVPGKPNRTRDIEIEDAQGSDLSMQLDTYFVDDEFIPVYGLRLRAGRNFCGRIGSDSLQALIVNETLVQRLGYRRDEDILGKSFRSGETQGKVIGVVDDFWAHSPREAVPPMAMRMWGFHTYLTLSVNATVTPELISRIDRVWNTLMPDEPLIWFGVGENYNSQFESDAHMATMLGAFAVLAALISAFGLLGLTALAVTRRTKEIGIRKVLGATTTQVLRLMSKQTIIMLLVAIAVGSALSARVLAWWLDGFAHHVTLPWWSFAFAGLVTFVLGFLASTLLSLRAANSDPVKTLRTE